MDHAEIARLVNRLHKNWYPSLVRYAARATGSLEMAEDLVQDAFVELCAQLLRGAEIGHHKAWTFQVVRRQIAKRLSAGPASDLRCQSLDALEELDNREYVPPVLRADPDDEMDDLTKLIALLTTREEEVILLRMEGFTYREIGGQLGIATSSVKTLLARAMRKMQSAARPPKWKNSRATDARRNELRTSDG